MTIDQMFEAELLDLHNRYRILNRLRPLAPNSKLRQAAIDHAKWMAETETMSHVGRDHSSFITRLKNAGYQYSYAGENIAFGYGLPANVMKGWAQSPGHRANILNPKYREIGIGFARGINSSRFYWCVDFGAPLGWLRIQRSPNLPDGIEG